MGGLLVLEAGDALRARVIQRFPRFSTRVMGVIAEVSDGLRAFRGWVADADELPLHGLIDVKNHLFIEILLFLPRQGKLNKFL